MIFTPQPLQSYIEIKADNATRILCLNEISDCSFSENKDEANITFYVDVNYREGTNFSFTWKNNVAEATKAWTSLQHALGAHPYSISPGTVITRIKE